MKVTKLKLVAVNISGLASDAHVRVRARVRARARSHAHPHAYAPKYAHIICIYAYREDIYMHSRYYKASLIFTLDKITFTYAYLSVCNILP